MGDYVDDITHMPIFEPIAPVGASRQIGEISLSRGYSSAFVTCIPIFTLVDYKTAKKFLLFPLTQKHPKRGMNRQFQAYRANYILIIKQQI